MKKSQDVMKLDKVMSSPVDQTFQGTLTLDSYFAKPMTGLQVAVKETITFDSMLAESPPSNAKHVVPEQPVVVKRF